MQTQSSDSVEDGDGGASLSVPIPVRDERLFKHAASAPILNFLADNPEFNLSIRQLSRVTPVSDRATGLAVDVLAANGLVEVVPEGNARRVRLNRDRFRDPDDPVERIPQAPYRTPVRVACHYLADELTGIVGIILYGSVARGEADRQSDIDLWVLVDGTSADLLEQRNAANKLERHLEGLQIPPSVALRAAQDHDFASRWPTIRERLEDTDHEWHAAQRYTFEIVVETPQSIRGQAPRVDVTDLFGAGITIVSSETLDRVKREVLADE
jgi:predicted nucleotidyltransferase